MVQLKRVTTFSEIEGIKKLQDQNLSTNISAEEAASQGFLTAAYTIEFLEEMNSFSPAIIAKDGDDVVGYALVATQDIRTKHDLLEGLFDSIDLCEYSGNILKEEKYVVVGQLCVAKSHRGQGLVHSLYGHFWDCLKDEYRYLVTDVAKSNTRSLGAHKKRGFEVINELMYGGFGWDIVLWDWNKQKKISYLKP